MCSTSTDYSRTSVENVGWEARWITPPPHTHRAPRPVAGFNPPCNQSPPCKTPQPTQTPHHNPIKVRTVSIGAHVECTVLPNSDVRCTSTCQHNAHAVSDMFTGTYHLDLRTYLDKHCVLMAVAHANALGWRARTCYKAIVRVCTLRLCLQAPQLCSHGLCAINWRC